MNRCLYLFVFFLLAFLSCQKQLREEPAGEFLKVDSTRLAIPAEAPSKDSFTISSNIQWQLNVLPLAADWLSISVTAGNGNSKVTVSILKNNTSDTVRTATIVISPVSNATIKPLTITVTQNKAVVKARNVYGGSDMDEFSSVVAVGDGSYIAIGSTTSKNGDVSGVHSSWEDVWVIKIAANGEKVWQKALGGTSRDMGERIIKTPDGNYLILGNAGNNDGDAAGGPGTAGAWLIKIDGNGTVIWKKVIGNATNEVAISVVAGTNGGYVMVGSANIGAGNDFWVTKVNDNGDKLWSKFLGGAGYDFATAIITGSDNGYVIAGTSQSKDGDVTNNHGLDDFWVIKIDENGNKIWQKSYGGTDVDFCNSITKSSDGGYVLTGGTKSNNGDVTGNHGKTDIWVIKLDLNGNKIWQKTLGGSDEDYGNCVITALDGGFLVSGSARSTNGDVGTPRRGFDDAWVIKLDASGNKSWEKVLGGTDEEIGNDILETSPGNYVMAGTTFSADGDIVGFHGYGDAWLMKFSK